MKENRREILIALGYTVIMSIAMSVAYQVFGYQYSDINIVKVLVWFEIVMTIYALMMYIKFYKKTALKN